MNRSNLFLVLGLAGGTCLGFLASGSVSGFGFNAKTAPDNTGMDHSMHQMDGMKHDHDRIQEVEGDVPSLMLHLQSEGNCTFNLHMMMENFRLAPENVNGPHVSGEGHAHLYVDGEKHARIYSEWVHFTAPRGSKAIEITLNSNDHATLAHQGKPIRATADLSDC